MRKMLIILISTVVTILNINCYGELDSQKLERAIEKAKKQDEITLDKSINWSLGSTLFKLIHFTEILFLSEIGRKRFIS